jgi:hypothetical protein
MALALSASAADDPFDVYVSAYGAKAKNVSATPETTDDVALAKELLESARKFAAQAPVAVLLAEKSFEFGRKAPEGYATAIAAMEFAATTDESKAPVCLEKVVDIRVLQAQRAQGTAGAPQAVSALVSALEVAGDARDEAGEFKSALVLYRRAIAYNPLHRELLQWKIDAAACRDKAQDRANALAAILKDKPDDAKARAELLMLLVVELDNPPEAQKVLIDESDATYRRLVPLAAKPLGEVDEPGCLELAEWYRTLSEKASAEGKRLTLTRAKAYLERFLELHTENDTARLKAQLTLDAVTKSLAALAAPARKLPPKAASQPANTTASGTSAPGASTPRGGPPPAIPSQWRRAIDDWRRRRN